MSEFTPVTVLTGFLGAGKSTLLNHLLAQPALAGTAVLVNEFGEVGIDHLLVRKLDENTVLLNAGCLCCSVRGDLVRALRDLLPSARRGDVSRVVIETTGLADPAPILATLLGDGAVTSTYRLDGIVTVVDAVNGMATLDAHFEAVRQVAVADRLILTKTDLTENTGALTARLARLNPGAPLATAVNGVIDPQFVLGAGVFDSAGKSADVRSWLDAAPFEAAHEHAHDDVNRHDAHIAAFCLTFDRPLPWQGIGSYLEILVATRGESLLRVKGILNLQGQGRPVVVHGVQHLFHPPALLPSWPDDDDRKSRIVFITRDLPRAIIEEGLNAFLAAAQERI